MNTKTTLDLLHARAQGRLTSAEQAELERALAADPVLRALAEDYSLVHALTALEPLGTSSRTSYEELEPRLARRSVLRRAAAAAAIVAVGGGAFLAGRASRGEAEPLVLRSIELNTPPAPDAPADLPGPWADYDPRGEGGVRFLGDLEEAELLARAVARPLLVYGSYPGCPMAAALDAKVFSDPAVIELAERTVPVHLDLAQLSEDEQRSLTARGYPFLEIWRDGGRTAHSLARNPDAGVFVESLHDGLEKSDATGEQPPWEGLRSAAARFGAARRAELEGRLSEAERGFRALAEDPGAPEAIVARALAGIARLSRSARALLLETRAAAQDDVEAALRLLEHGLERFAGTSFERDLRAALERLERDGRFPTLAEGDRSA